MLSMLPLNSFVPDYIGVIKENNKKVEKLESYIEKQQDGMWYYMGILET